MISARAGSTFSTGGDELTTVEGITPRLPRHPSTIQRWVPWDRRPQDGNEATTSDWGIGESI